MPDRDLDAPVTFRIADACICGSVYRVNIVAGARATRTAVQSFRDRHTGPGHGPAEVVLDRRTLDRRDLPGNPGRL